MKSPGGTNCTFAKSSIFKAGDIRWCGRKWNFVTPELCQIVISLLVLRSHPFIVLAISMGAAKWRGKSKPFCIAKGMMRCG
jgi:hypothetical protein